MVDPRFVNLTARQTNRSQLLLELQPLLLSRSSAEWTEILDRHDVPNGPVLNVLQLLDHPLAKERKMFRPLGQQLGDLSVSRYPVLARGVPIEESEAGHSPALGEQSAEILQDWLGVTSA